MIKNIKKVAAIHDISGLGRCSLTAAIPILSVLGVQPCPFPTAILSCQTGYSKFSFLDLTEEMINYKNSWDEMGFAFDGIYSGFLGSEKQIDIVKEFILSQNSSFVLIDPVMGDGGKIYKTYTEVMCRKMKELVSLATVTTPNITEACIISGKEYKNGEFSLGEIEEMAKEICALGPKKVVITGIIKGNEIINFAYDMDEDKKYVIVNNHSNKSFGGTGDIFASIICGMLMNGRGFEEAIKMASEFVYKAICYSATQKIDVKNGVVFEPILKELFI